MSAKRRALSPVGKSWLDGLHVPAAKFPDPIVTGIMYCETPPVQKVMAKALEDALWPLHRFHDRVVDGHFVPMEGIFDADYHCREVNDLKDQAALDAYIESQMALSLDPAHPLWQITVARCAKGGGRGCVILRLHHVIGDGLGMLFAVLPMLKNDTCDVLDTIALPAILKGKPSAKAPVAAGSSEKLAEKPKPKPNKPSFLAKLWDWIGGCPRRCKAVGQGVFSLLVVTPDAELKINPPISARKPFLAYSGRHRMTRFPPIPMSLVKAVREQHGCTVNDVIMTALTGAIRRYCAEDLKDPLFESNWSREVECKCTMLLALPRPIDRANPSVSLCNNILTPMFKLPVGECTAVGRLRRTVAMANFLKSMPYIMGINMTTKLLASIMPRSMMQPIVSETLSKITCNVTSLPLPAVPVTLAGAEITEMQCLFVNNVPQVGFISYNGTIYANIICDPQLIPDAAALGRHVLDEINLLAKPSSK